MASMARDAWSRASATEMASVSTPMFMTAKVRIESDRALAGHPDSRLRASCHLQRRRAPSVPGAPAYLAASPSAEPCGRPVTMGAVFGAGTAAPDEPTELTPLSAEGGDRPRRGPLRL